MTSGGQAFHTPLTRVNVGDRLVGNISFQAGSGNLFSYQSEFEGIPATRLPVQNTAELLWFNQTLEAYNIQRCSNCPLTSPRQGPTPQSMLMPSMLFSAKFG